MHIPVKVDYGVRALVDLALHADEQPITASEIAQRTMIPEPYLAQVMHALGKVGIVRAQRGPQGGHALALAPDEIRLSMIMDCLGSSENLVACLDNIGSCVHVPACAQREVWQSVELAVYQILDSKTISDLVLRSQAIKVSQELAARSAPLTIQRSNDPKTSLRRERNSMAFVKVGKISDVAPGTSKVYEIGDRNVAVCNVSGNFYAVDDICPHDEGSLEQGDLDGFEIECPRHMARFDVRTGEVKALPAVVPIDIFEVRIDGDDIEVDV